MINLGSYFRLRHGENLNVDVSDKSLSTFGLYVMTTLNWCNSVKVVSFDSTLDIVFNGTLLFTGLRVMMMKKRNSVFTGLGQHLGGKL